jgi:hypothetical protein
MGLHSRRSLTHPSQPANDCQSQVSARLEGGFFQVNPAEGISGNFNIPYRLTLGGSGGDEKLIRDGNGKIKLSGSPQE